MEFMENSLRRFYTKAFLGSTISLAVVFFAACGASDSKSPLPVLCSGAGEAQNRDALRPHFLTRQLKGAANEGAAFLYELNTASGSVRAILNRGSDATDALVFRDSRTGQLLWLERLMARNSRLTRISCEEKSKSRERGDLPENTFGIGYFDPVSLVALGWNDGKVSVFSEDFKRTLVANKSLESSDGTSVLAPNDGHFNSFLSRGEARYVLSTGYDLASFQPSQAKFLRLNETGTKWDTVFDIPECSNAYQEYTFQPSGSEIIMGCNPRFNGNNGKPVRLVYSNIDDAGTMGSRPLAANIENDASMILPGGIRVGGSWVFVTEQKVSESSRITVNPGRYLRSYWLSLKSGEKKPMPGIAGNVVFDAIERNYVFSCVVPKDSADGECSRNTFAILTESQWDRPELAKTIQVPYEYDFVQFERPIF